MDFLKKHYEKLILAVFLLIFVFLLLYLVELSKSTHTISKKDLQIPTSNPNYMPQNFSDKKYAINYIFTNDSLWKKSVARKDKDKIYSDLLSPFECARCPFGNKVIPRYYFLGPVDKPRKCPLCGETLLRPITKAAELVGERTGMDRDNDGIPNVIEIKLGLNPDNPDDAFYDTDNDGFPNVFEYQEKTDIKKTKSHPKMYKRLRLVEFRETLLPFILKGVVTNNKKDPKYWDIQINKTRRGKIKTIFQVIDGFMILDNTAYKIVKINPLYKEERRGGSIIKEDKSSIVLKSNDGKYTITMQAEKPVYSPKPKAVVEDLGTGKMYHVGVGDAIVMTLKYEALKRGKLRKLTRTRKYKVVEVSRKDKRIVIEDKKLKKYTITAKTLMPRIKQAGNDEKVSNKRSSGFMAPPPGGR